MHRRTGTDREAFNILFHWLNRTKQPIQINIAGDVIVQPPLVPKIEDELIPVGKLSRDPVTEEIKFEPIGDLPVVDGMTVYGPPAQ